MMFKKKEFAQGADNVTEVMEGKEERATESRDSEAVIAQWQRDGEQLAIIVPEFSLNEAVKNEAFAKALKEGATVFEAYKAMMAVPKPEKREEILQNARSARRGTGSATVNPAKLSSSEFKKYIDNIRG